MFVKTYFTGYAEPSTKEEDAEMEAILNSPPFQGAYCNYLIHTSMELKKAPTGHGSDSSFRKACQSVF